MTTPARRHRIRHEVAAAKAATESDQMRADLTQYELHLAQLAEHKRTLKKIQSVEKKVAYKSKVLPEYDAYIDGALEHPAALGTHDDVLTTIMVWDIDASRIDQALDIGAYVLEHAIPLPDRFDRTAPTVLTEEIADQALRDIGLIDLSAGEISAWQAHLQRLADLAQPHDMPDEVRAKLHKALGLVMRGTNDAEALTHLRRALQLHDKAGVKKDIERLERALKNDPAKSSQPSAETSADAAGTPSQSRQEAD